MNFVADWATIKYSFMRRDIMDMQDEIELREIRSIEHIDRLATDKGGDERVSLLTEWCSSNADSVVTAWWDFSEDMIVKYDDGYVNSAEHMAHEEGYSQRWLDTTEWVNGPITYAEPEK
jgi:dipeptidase